MKLTHGSTRLIKAGMLLALLLILPGICCGQGLGSIVGTITDPSGAVVPTATITVINPATGFTRHAGSNAQGYFVIPSLPPAQYDLTVRATGAFNS
jgi:hypothetical protein